MRSLFARVLLWSIAVAILSGAAFVYITRATIDPPPAFGGPTPRRFPFLFLEARKIYEAEGKAALAAHLARLRRSARIECVLTDAEGVDLVSGEHRSDLLGNYQEVPMMRRGRGFWEEGPKRPRARIIGTRSLDGRYMFFMMPASSPILPPFLSWYHLAVLGVLAALSFLLVRHLTSPVKEMELALERFGGGDLGARVRSRRGDELGRLANTFDKMAERIQTLLDAERRLLMDISHEIRSPLTRLNLAVELARSVEDREAALDRIQREADRLNQLVGGLLQVTRAEGDPRALRMLPVDLRALVNEVAADAEIDAEAKRCRIAIDAPATGEVQGDHELLRRAIENVLRNAIRYSPEGATVELRLIREGSQAVVEVRDHGPGVPNEMLDRLFEPFFRVEESEEKRSSGFGLGLSIARRAVVLHGGTIQAANAGPGLRVRIGIPRKNGAGS